MGAYLRKHMQVQKYLFLPPHQRGSFQPPQDDLILTKDDKDPIYASILGSALVMSFCPSSIKR